MKDPPLGSRASAVDGRPSSQQGPGVSGAGFDDDYNEWELGIGDLIIDLDADIEKSNDPAMASAAAAAGGPTAAQAAPPPAQAAASSPPVEHQATVDKGLKMKIKRKNLAKHEIVKAQDTGSSPLPANSASSSAATKHSSSSSSSLSSSSSKGGSGRSGSHKKKRLENGASPPRLPPQCALGVTQGAPESPLPPLPAPSSVVATAVTEQQQSANGVSPPSPVAEEVAAEEAASEVPLKKIKMECPESPSRSAVAATSGPVERRDSGVLCSSVGTITEPDCLGPCEPGTSVTLEGIVWQETEGGVLVVNVTWRGKTYVGTLLDCTRHDWAPPRFCESPTSDLDAKGGLPKGGRPKRARGDPEAANRGGCTPVQGKLRNGKGRRFAVPCSPAKGEGRRRTATRPPELELSPPDKKRARARGTPPTPEAPCSPALIPCPEPHCGKKYKHINGLRYHQSHAHGCGDAKGGEEETSDGGEEGSSPPSPTIPPILPPAPPVAVAPVPAPAAPEEPSPSPPVSVTVSIPTSQVFSFVPAAPRAASPPPVRALATPVCPPDSVPSAAPPSSPKAAPPVVAEPPGQAVVPQAASLDAVLRQHKRPHKKGKGRKSEGGPPDEVPEGPLPLAAAAAAETSLPLEQAPPNLEESVQSPAYSDISDDAAPLLEAAKDKEPPRGPPGELYGVYPYFGQPPYLLPGVQPPPEAKPPPPPNPAAEEEAAKKEGGVLRDKAPKEPSRDGPTPQEPPGKKPDFPQFPPYSLCAGGPYVGGGTPGYPFHEPYHVHMVDSSPSAFKEDKSGGKDAPGIDKGAPPPLDKNSPRVLPPHPRRNQSPEAPVPPKERLCKEEAKEEPKFSPYEPLYERRFLYLQDPPPAEAPPKEAPPTPKAPPPHPPKSRPPKEPKDKDGGGQKPTMETTGPPPPSNYAYLHPGYLPPHFPPHVAFESVYRGLPHYGGSPYLRFHVPAPEVPQQAPGPPVVGQVGGPQGPPKALDLLHQVSQHYSNHKIHELQERAVPSPSPHAGPGDRPPRGGPPEKGPPRGDPGPLAPLEAGPKGGGMPVAGVPLGGVPPQQQQGPGPGGGPPGPTQNPDGTSRSPPPQRHLHTHHHTHVGVGYPLYDPYGAMIASQQAAACAVAASSNLHPFVPK